MSDDHDLVKSFEVLTTGEAASCSSADDAAEYFCAEDLSGLSLDDYQNLFKFMDLTAQLRVHQGKLNAGVNKLRQQNPGLEAKCVAVEGSSGSLHQHLSQMRTHVSSLMDSLIDALFFCHRYKRPLKGLTVADLGSVKTSKFDLDSSLHQDKVRFRERVRCCCALRFHQEEED